MAVFNLPIGGVLSVTEVKNPSLGARLAKMCSNQPWRIATRRQTDGSYLLYKVSRNGSAA